MIRTQQPATRLDFHLALMFIRSLESCVGRAMPADERDRELTDLFERYRSPWRA